MPHPIIREELALLDRVRAALAESPERAGASEAGIVRELERLRELLVDGADAKDRATLLEQWDRQSALLQQLRDSRQAAPVDPDSPYFGHLRLAEGREQWDICLGRATFIDRGVRIVDWRHAPISRLFYRYSQGEEYEEEIAGRVRTGTVAARRTVTIRNGRLERVQAAEGIFSADPSAPDVWVRDEAGPLRLAGGEGTAFRIYTAGEETDRRLGSDPHGLRERADKHLPDIAGLIDKEQFELMTRPSTGLVVVRGMAGSGKTTVALHRIAYLTYENPAIDSERTLFLVFSKALRNYVGHVLPALGITRVQIRTFPDWAAEQRRRLFPTLPRETRHTAPAVVQRLKLHPVMLVVLEEQVRRVAGPASAQQAIDDWASALSGADLLEETFSCLAPRAFTREELQRAAAWNRDRHEELIAWRQDPANPAELDAEDDALLLRAWQLRVGPLPGRSGRPLQYRHIAIDEVQDFSPLEVRVLLDCLDQQQSMTLAGDTQQHVLQETGFTSWNDFFDHLGVTGTEVSTLRISYRSTQQIMEFALGVLGDLREEDEPVRTTRNGPPVEYFRFTDHGACVAFLTDALKHLVLREPRASVAILTPSAELSRMYFQALENGEVPALGWVRDQEFSFAPGIEITEIDQVKGLEFDYVILVEVSAANFPETPHARRLLHVGATRAIHQLWLTSVATPSRLVHDPTAGA